MMNTDELEIPVLTDVIDMPAAAPHLAPVPPDNATPQLEQILYDRLSAELALQVPVLLEAALREHLPQAMGARFQAELLLALTTALPVAAQAAARELSSQVAYEVGGLLEQRLKEEIRRAVTEEIGNASS